MPSRVGECACGSRRYWTAPRVQPHFVVLEAGSKRPAGRWRHVQPTSARVRAARAADRLGVVPASVGCGVIDIDAGELTTVLRFLHGLKVRPLGVHETQTPGHWHVWMPAAPGAGFRFRFADGTCGEWISDGGYVRLHALEVFDAVVRKARGRKRQFDAEALPRVVEAAPSVRPCDPTAPVAPVAAVRGQRDVALFEAARRRYNRAFADGEFETLRAALAHGYAAAEAMWRALPDRVDFTLSEAKKCFRSAIQHHFQRHRSGLGPYRSIRKRAPEASQRGGWTRAIGQRLARVRQWRAVHGTWQATRRVNETCRRMQIGKRQFYRAVAFCRLEASPPTPGGPPLNTARVTTPWSRLARSLIEAWRRLTAAPVPHFHGALAPP